jgi:hypothetical protein
MGCTSGVTYLRLSARVSLLSSKRWPKSSAMNTYASDKLAGSEGIGADKYPNSDAQ